MISARQLHTASESRKHSSIKSITRNSPYRLSPKKRKSKMLLIPSKSSKNNLLKLETSSKQVENQTSSDSLRIFKRRASFVYRKTETSPSPERRQFRQLIESERLKLMTMDLYPLTKHSLIFLTPKMLKLGYQSQRLIKKHPQRAFR